MHYTDIADLISAVEQINGSRLQQVRNLLSEVSQVLKRQPEEEFPIKFEPFACLNLSEMQLSSILAYFLNPKEGHCQGTLFLEAFGRLVKTSKLLSRNEMLASLPDLDRSTKVSLETSLLVKTDHQSTAESKVDGADKETHSEKAGRADILIHCTDGIILIENKPKASDGYHQLERYAKWLKEQSTSKIVLVYLSSTPPSQQSLGESGIGADFSVWITYQALAEAWMKANEKTKSAGVHHFCQLLFAYLAAL